MIFLIIALLYGLCLVKVIFFAPKDEVEDYWSFFFVISLVMGMATINLGVQTRKATLLKEEIENKKSNCDAL
jgi:hypothetical protein